MLSKSLIQFSVDGRGCVPSLLFDQRPKYGGGNEDSGDLLQKVLCSHYHTQRLRPCSRPPQTHASTGDSGTLTGKSGSVSCGVTSLFSWVLVCTRFVPSKILFPQSRGSSVIKSHWPPKSNSLGVLSPFAGPPGWGIWCGSWNFGNSAGTSLVHHSPVCGLFARWLYGGAHMLHLSGLLQPDPLSVQ